MVAKPEFESPEATTGAAADDDSTPRPRAPRKRSPRAAAAAGSSGGRAKKRYRGVRMRSWGSWVSEIRAPNQKTRIWLGSYSTAEAAARAYDAALVCLKGSAAALNFPGAPPDFVPPPEPLLMSPRAIQRVAAAAAAAPGANFNFSSDSNSEVPGAERAPGPAEAPGSPGPPDVWVPQNPACWAEEALLLTPRATAYDQMLCALLSSPSALACGWGGDEGAEDEELCLWSFC